MQGNVLHAERSALLSERPLLVELSALLSERALVVSHVCLLHPSVTISESGAILVAYVVYAAAVWQ